MGHIGFAICLYLSNKNYNVIGIYNKTKDKYKTNLLKKNRIILIKNNLTNSILIKKILKKYKVKDCIYCSAVSHESIAKKNIDKTIKVNCISLNKFLNFQKKRFFNKLIYISTGSVFQNIKSSKYKIDESTQPTPNSIYSITKRLGEILIDVSFKSNLQRSCVLRVSWVYGPPLLTKTIIPQRGPIPYLVNKLICENKKEITFKSGGDFTASFTYIDDICITISKMLKLKKFSKNIYHLGTGTNHSNFELAKTLNKIFPEKKIKFGKGFSPWSNDSVVRGPLISKYKLPFLKTKYNLKSGLIRFIDFAKENLN
tara:strand:- start:6825 stop:7763 length:939 start_codon:yes stop_codon:yes gene_type:complete